MSDLQSWKEVIELQKDFREKSGFRRISITWSTARAPTFCSNAQRQIARELMRTESVGSIELLSSNGEGVGMLFETEYTGSKSISIGAGSWVCEEDGGNE